MERTGWTGFASHLAGLKGEKIKSSYNLPTQAASTNKMNLNAHDLVSILSAASSLLRNAYKLCSGTLKRVTCGHEVSGDVGYYVCNAFV